jgi:hypothetical protein
MLAAGRCARLLHGGLDRLRVVEKALEVWVGVAASKPQAAARLPADQTAWWGPDLSQVIRVGAIELT